MSKSTVRGLLAKGQLKRLAGLGLSTSSAVRYALWDTDWIIRRNALRVFDHLSDAEALPRMVELLKDDHQEVRKWAAHSLGCDRCKTNGGTEPDPVPFLIEVAIHDVSLDVRRSAVVCLAWNRPVDPRIHQFLAGLVESTSDPKIRRHARDGLIRHAMPANAA